jgi:hypothetical protein
MPVSIDWNTKIISVPISFLTLISGGGGAGSLYELDVNAFRLALKDIEDDPEGMAQDDTHRHNGEVTLAGITYARSFEIINGYTVSFETLGGGAQYTVRCVNANHNIGDVTNWDAVNLVIGNAAGLIVNYVSSGSGLSTEQDQRLTRVEKFLRNKRITDPSTGKQTIYDDNGVDVLVQGDLFEDVAGAQPYRGQGAQRADRLV